MTSPATVTLVADTAPVQVQVDVGVLAPVVVSAALQGARGPAGPPGDALQVVAAEPLSGHRVIAAGGVYAGGTDATALAVLGLSTGAAAVGDAATLQRSGEMDWPAGGLTPDLPLYLASAGQLTQAAPTLGWLRQIAVAIAADRIVIDIGPAYWLGA